MDRRALALTASGGVVLSAPAAFILDGNWRLTFAIFAVVALVGTLAVLSSTPRNASASGNRLNGLAPFNDDVKRLCTAAFLMGAASTAIWSFGGELTRRTLGWTGR